LNPSWLYQDATKMGHPNTLQPLGQEKVLAMGSLSSPVLTGAAKLSPERNKWGQNPPWTPTKSLKPSQVNWNPTKMGHSQTLQPLGQEKVLAMGSPSSPVLTRAAKLSPEGNKWGQNPPWSVFEPLALPGPHQAGTPQTLQPLGQEKVLAVRSPLHIRTREPGDGIGGEDGGGLVPGVHHTDAHLLAGHQDGGDVATSQGEDEADAVCLQHIRHQLTTMPGASWIDLQGEEFPGRTCAGSPMLCRAASWAGFENR